MLKNKYKACFDDVKGEPALLEKILGMAEDTSKDLKRIKLLSVTKYTASVAAAAVVVVSAAFLYNSGLLEADVVKENVNEAKNYEHKLTDKKYQLAEKTSDNTSDKTAEKALEKNENVKAKAVKKENENNYMIQKSKVATAEEVKMQGIEEDSLVNTESVEAEENLPENSAITNNEEIKKTVITPENGEADKISGEINTANAQVRIASAGDGGGGSSAVAARTDENMLEAYDGATETSEETGETEKTYDERLTVFKEGIMNIPENEYSDDSKKILVYTNEDRTKKIELTFIRNTDRKPIADGNTLIETKNGYVIIETENISMDYLDEIILYFAEK